MRRDTLRTFLTGGVGVALLLTAAACGGGGSTAQSTQEVSIGGLWPISGPFALDGKAMEAGAQYAVTEINASGGIKGLGGAKLKLTVVDAGGTAEQATSGMQRLLSDQNMVAAACCWTSTLALPATEVSERAGLPVISDGFADNLTGRGFKYIFDISPSSSKIPSLFLDQVVASMKQGGIDVKNVALVGDNSPAAAALQKALPQEFTSRGINISVNEQWTPPLLDAAGVAQKVANAHVDVVFAIAYQFNDVSTLIAQLRSRGVTVPVVQNGGQALLPQWRQYGNSILGLSTFVTTNILKSSNPLSTKMAKETGDPYVWQDQLMGYAEIQLLAAALDKAGKADRESVRKAFVGMNLTSGPALNVLPTSSVKFDSSGRVDPVFGVLAEWQAVGSVNIPCTVYPATYALCGPKWK